MKKIFSAIIITAMAFTAVNCSNSNEPQSSETALPSSSTGENTGSADVISLSAEATELEKGLSALKYSDDYSFDESSVGLSFGGSPFGCSTISTIDPKGNFLFGRNFECVSRKAMAEKINIDWRYLANIENDVVIPSLSVVIQLIKACESPVERCLNPEIMREESEQRQRVSQSSGAYAPPPL